MFFVRVYIVCRSGGMVDAKALRAFVIKWRGGSSPLSDTR